MAALAHETTSAGALLVAVLGETREAQALRTVLREGGDAVVLADRVERANAIVDASHPFASDGDFDSPTRRQIALLKPQSRYLRLVRQPWTPRDGDDWRQAPSPGDAFEALDPAWRRIFLAVGRDRITPFQTDPDRWYLTRVRGAEDLLQLTAHGALAPEPGPFTVEGEMALLTRHRIDALVCRNVGGAGAFPKVEAARRLGLPVVLLEAPAPVEPSVGSVASALAWLAERAVE